MNKIILQKGFAISALACVILIALYMVSGVIDDRQKYRDAAVQSIEGSYAGPQILIGPVLVRPYTQTIETTETNDKGIKKTSVRKQELTATSFPRELNMHGVMLPSERRHGLYRVEVYELQGQLKGHFDVVDPQTEGTVVWGEPYFHVFCQWLGAGASAPASVEVCSSRIPMDWGTGQQSATVAQTSIRGLGTARTCVVAGLPRT